MLNIVPTCFNALLGKGPWDYYGESRIQSLFINKQEQQVYLQMYKDILAVFTYGCDCNLCCKGVMCGEGCTFASSSGMASVYISQVYTGTGKKSFVQL